ncbi:Regulator of chromosome condensation [Chytriomyces hyalinus]|nr:Regulator of chromosome condensation [Chytriomyces hyalinus]
MALSSNAPKLNAHSTAANKLMAHSKSSSEKLPEAMTLAERTLKTIKPVNSTTKQTTSVHSVPRPGCDIRHLHPAKPLPKPTYASQIATKSTTTSNQHAPRKLGPRKAAEDSLMKSFGKHPNDYSLCASDVATYKSSSSVSRSAFFGNKAAVAAEPQSKPPGKRALTSTSSSMHPTVFKFPKGAEYSDTESLNTSGFVQDSPMAASLLTTLFSTTSRPTTGTQTSFVNSSAQLHIQERRSNSSSVEVAEKPRRLERAIQNLDQLLQQASSGAVSFSRQESKLKKNMSEMLLEVDELIQSHNRESQCDMRSIINLNSELLQQKSKPERPTLSLRKTQSASVIQTSTKPHLARTPPLATSRKTFNTRTALAGMSDILNAELDGRSINVNKSCKPESNSSSRLLYHQSSVNMSPGGKSSRDSSPLITSRLPSRQPSRETVQPAAPKALSRQHSRESMQALSPKASSRQHFRESVQALSPNVLSTQPAREFMQPVAPTALPRQHSRETMQSPTVLSKQSSLESMQSSAPWVLLESVKTANPHKSKGSETSASSIRFQETSKADSSHVVSPMVSSIQAAPNPSHLISRHSHTSSHPPASTTSLVKRRKSLSTVKDQSPENESAKSKTETRTPDSPVLQKSSDIGVFRRGSLSVSSVSDASTALLKTALDCRAISHDSFTQSSITENKFSSNAVRHRSQLCTTIMEDAATSENVRFEEDFEQEPESIRQSPILLENHQAEESFRLDDFSFQIPNSRQSFSFTQSPLHGSPLSDTFRDLQPEESFHDKDLSVAASHNSNVESCQDEQPSHSYHESLTKQSVLPSTPFDEMNEQPVLQPNAGCTGEEATRLTTIKRVTSLVFADKRTPKTSIQQWASMFDINPTISSFNLRLDTKEARFSREDISHKQPVQSNLAASTCPTPYNTSAELSPTIRVVHKQTEWSEVSMKHSVSEVEQSSSEVLPWQQCVESKASLWEPLQESEVLEMAKCRSSVPSRLNASDCGQISSPKDVRDACLVENGEPLEIPKPIEYSRKSSARSFFEEMAAIENVSCEDELVQPRREQQTVSAAAHSIQNDQKAKNTLLRVPLSSTQHTLASISKPAVSQVENLITANYEHVRSMPNNNDSQLESFQKSFAKATPSSFSQDRSFSQLLKDAKTDNQKLHTIANRANDAIDLFKSGFENLHSEHSKLRDRFSRAEDAVRQMRAMAADAKAFASKPRLEFDSQANDADADMSQAVLEFMKYVQASHANPSLSTRTQLPIVGIRKSSQHRIDLFSVGQNDDGQMGIFNNEYEGGIPCSNVMKAVKLPVCSPLVKLVSGGMHTVALTSSGEILSWGAADFIGRIDSSKNWQAQLIPFDSKIVDAVCGECFTAVLDNDGHIWAWGSFRNTEGKEHFSATTSRQKTPMKLEGSPGQLFVGIAAGESHLLALCRKGKVYGWGINSHGQLGRPSLLSSRHKLCSGVPFVLPPNLRVRRVFAAGFSTFVEGIHLDKETRIYACGGNCYGEMGVDDIDIKWHLSEVESMRGQEIEDIKGGLHHTVLLRKDGSVWVAGRGQNGQLDLISDHGELFSCGYNCYGQLALKMEEDVIYTPHQVPLKGRTAILVSAGCQFAVLSASGK